MGFIGWITVAWTVCSVIMVTALIIEWNKGDVKDPIWPYVVPVAVLAPFALFIWMAAFVMNEVDLRRNWPNGNS